MRLALFLLWACITAVVAAKGLRVGYEKVFLYYAWKIDQTNPEAERTIGIRCAEVLDLNKGGCKDPEKPTDPKDPPKQKYIPCQYESKKFDRVQNKLVVTMEPCVTLRHFMSHIDNKDWNKKTPIPGSQADQATEAPDVDKTAMNINAENMDQNRYLAWRVIKDGTSFNRMIEDIGTVISRRRNAMTPEELAANKQFFDGAERAIEGIKLQRQTDHAKYLIPKLKAALPTVDFKTDDVVVNAKGEMGQNFNFQKTIDDNVTKITDIRDKLEAELTNHYKSDKDALDHKIVMESFEITLNQIRGASCSSV
ncbi:hypothetical protein LZ32DRAFT_619917 [Colletotrichum eremochloae]|nr:hypothetical protein LZ32DRAFT_619917 [Colletotrichum eremochloae]